MNTANEKTKHRDEVNLQDAEGHGRQLGNLHAVDRNGDTVTREIEAAERWRERLTHGLVHFPDGTVAVSEEMDLLLGMKCMEVTVDRIVSTNASATKKVKLPFGEERYGHRLTKLGEDIWRVCRSVVPLIEQVYPECRRPAQLSHVRNASQARRPAFNPRITVALHACQIAKPILRRCGRGALDVNEGVVRRALDRLLRSIRRICRSRRFKYLENNYRQNARLRLRDASKYVARLFAQKSRLLVLRVDLYFRPVNGEWVDTAAAGRCVKSYLRALRDGRVVPDMLGWLARIENGFRRGIHVHLFVAMDGHRHREAVSWSKVLGETWVNKFSAGHGAYFNCYTRKDWYKFNGLGLVHVSDHAKLLGIREALRYMTKADFQISTGFVKNFRKGQYRGLQGAVKRGAPRKDVQGSSLADVILRQA